MAALWIIVLVISVVLYGYLLACVLPKNLLVAEFTFEDIRDRGLRNIKETNGRSIVCQPSLENRKYISQYVISERNGKKILLCKLEQNVNYIDYDIVMVNGQNKVFKVLNVKELATKDGFTQKIELDDEVAYVSLNVNAANDEKISPKRISSVPAKRFVFYALASAGVTVVEIFLAKLCCAYIFGGVFAESFMLGGKSLLITISFIAVAIFINIALIFNVMQKINGKKRNKGE